MNKNILLKNKNILRIGLGTSGFGGYFGSNIINQDYKKKFINFFNKAYDYGIRFVDTAESYASGESEKLLGYLRHVHNQYPNHHLQVFPYQDNKPSQYPFLNTLNLF